MFPAERSGSKRFCGIETRAIPTKGAVCRSQDNGRQRGSFLFIVKEAVICVIQDGDDVQRAFTSTHWLFWIQNP
ncbi:hypothetical protein ETH_00004810 [Eimeria tenella]|uniref:Uncharacterized protein n=1 Tax=Eimeria tenella TaxID=5802 RepID=U6KGB1_EIMTE|nr:hypothetical protein ETH_00004810 [Eimeria tenella]CDJ36969.1 hypothetical protein ETH_00004810 [Eimeria tenella]|eukprot:XP_013227807.1 hypothetical protein ETH_00004810 [Eimeria tenella]